MESEHKPMEMLKKILTDILLVFVFISIGYILGKHSVNIKDNTGILPNSNGRQVAVYYLHSTFRCVTCNTIEEMTITLLNNQFADELADKRIIWQEVNFQENETIAKQFQVIASCVVVADLNNGIVQDYQRLDEVWTKMKNPDEFNEYISNAINKYLKKSGD